MAKTQTRYRRVCTCGHDVFKTNITLRVYDVPVCLTEDGILCYNDTAGQTKGWDTNSEPEVQCAKCGKYYNIARTGDKRAAAYLEEVKCLK